MTRGKKAQPSPLLAAMEMATIDEAMAVEFIEDCRWGEYECCPKCGSTSVYKMLDSKTSKRNKNYRWRCRDCNRMFTVRTGTILEESRLPLSVWVLAIWKASASKKGVSALQISRECKISYKSALFLMHRIRKSMGPENGIERKFSGTIEADEIYVGGKPRIKNKR